MGPKEGRGGDGNEDYRELAVQSHLSIDAHQRYVGAFGPALNLRPIRPTKTKPYKF